jgi:3-hydroxymyristoyl/3-hydroxydecanoyl-(acyl carrier protein) dehydratase
VESATLQSLLKVGRRRPLWSPGDGDWQANIGQNVLERVLPHRAPFLLVDAITEVDLMGGHIRGRRRIAPDDPVFVGHFPGEPIYPGVLQLEIIGQLGLCLMHFHATGSTQVPEDATPRRVRALKIHQALFLAAVLPGDNLQVIATLVTADDYTAICAGQLLKGDTVCAFAVMEVYCVDN